MRGERIIAGLLVATLVLSVVGGAAAQAIDDPQEIDYESNATPNVAIETTVTVDEVEPGWEPTEYEGNNGEVQELPAHVNDSVENPTSLVATNINEEEFTSFPNAGDDDSVSWADASEWSSGASMSLTETTTAPNVDALNFATDGSMTAGDSATATFSNVSISSDEERRYLQLAADVNTLDNATTVDVRVVDEDGDYTEVSIDPDNSTDDANVLANSEVDGAVSQVQLGELDVQTAADSDGEFNNIESIEVVANDGEADVSFALMNAERMSTYTFGEQRYDSDGDGEMDDTRTITEPQGEYGVTGLDTLGSTFDDATFRNVNYELTFSASDLEDASDAQVEFAEAESYPSFDWFGTHSYRLSLPDAYALSYSGSELVFTGDLPEDRYEVVQVAEDVGDTGFANVTGWTDYTDQVATGEQIVLSNTIGSGAEIAIQTEALLTDGERNDVESPSSSGAMGPTSSSDDGPLGFIMSAPGVIVGAIGALTSWRIGLFSKIAGLFGGS